MTFDSTNTTVGQLVVERPSRARVFERFGLDYCCGGRKPLAVACAERGLNLDEVVAALGQEDREPEARRRDWSAAGLADLADHIEQTHHEMLRRELPRLLYMTRRVAQAHGQKNPNWTELAELFQTFAEGLTSHMVKEEQAVFPAIRELERTEGRGAGLGDAVTEMEHEHDEAGRALERMRELTGGFTPDADACGTCRAMLSALAELEEDMHQHVHKENNILFPRALQLGRAAG